MQLTQSERAEIIARLQRIEDERLAILDVLLPPDEDDVESLDDVLPAVACRHPNDAIEDRSTMDEERYHCTACGSDFPHHPRRTNPEE